MKVILLCLSLIFSVFLSAQNHTLRMDRLKGRISNPTTKSKFTKEGSLLRVKLKGRKGSIMGEWEYLNDSTIRLSDKVVSLKDICAISFMKKSSLFMLSASALVVSDGIIRTGKNPDLFGVMGDISRTIIGSVGVAVCSVRIRWYKIDFRTSLTLVVSG